jgi:DNA gyrase/topoisomerase IV subunit A
MTHRFVTSAGAFMQVAGDDPVGQARRRGEILSAQVYAFDHVQEFFEIVGKATSPPGARRAISEAWKMTEDQAQIVLELQVHRFTQAERLMTLDELTDIRTFIAARGVSQGGD